MDTDDLLHLSDAVVLTLGTKCHSMTVITWMAIIDIYILIITVYSM